MIRDANGNELVLVNKKTGEKYRDLTARYSSRQAERKCHQRWKKEGWSDAQIAEFEQMFNIQRVQ